MTDHPPPINVQVHKRTINVERLGIGDPCYGGPSTVLEVGGDIDIYVVTHGGLVMQVLAATPNPSGWETTETVDEVIGVDAGCVAWGDAATLDETLLDEVSSGEPPFYYVANRHIVTPSGYGDGAYRLQADILDSGDLLEARLEFVPMSSEFAQPFYLEATP